MTSPPIIADADREWLGEGARRHWLLDPECAFLNNGSFGACPRPVLAAQDEWRRRMEARPVHFHVTEGPAAIRQAASRLAVFLGTSGDRLVFVDNATTGVNAVLRSLRWAAGDEIVYTNHGYGAVNNAVRFVAEREGLKAIEASAPFPIRDGREVVAAVARALSDRTRLAVLDHVTSATGVVFPVAALVALCHENGTAVLIDGAHAPGMLPLELDALGADYYAGNCHKWLFAPKGCGFLYARPNRQDDLHPPVISWGLGGGFAKEFDWTGTRDYTAWLSITAAIEFFEKVPAGRRRAYNDALASWAAGLLERAWGVEPAAPAGMRAHMATIALPGDLPAGRPAADRFHDRLYEKHRVEAPIMDFAGRLWVRISAQAYNVPGDYERLRDAVRAELNVRA